MEQVVYTMFVFCPLQVQKSFFGCWILVEGCSEKSSSNFSNGEKSWFTSGWVIFCEILNRKIPNSSFHWKLPISLLLLWL